MSFNWNKVVALAIGGLSVATEIGHEVGSVSHTQAANDSVDAAAAVAGSVLTDPEQIAEASAAAVAAKAIIGFVSLFHRNKPSVSPTPTPTAPLVAAAAAAPDSSDAGSNPVHPAAMRRQ